MGRNYAKFVIHNLYTIFMGTVHAKCQEEYIFVIDYESHPYTSAVEASEYVTTVDARRVSYIVHIPWYSTCGRTILLSVATL